ncbi:MAG: hypothetical protein AseanaTS_10350 [Candidatus Pelagadaptatus aseana]|uniref:LexA family protein n=1 Tax=Candidatus Pelagadaptatus aseana TaxID=3120508 RepID=UPI0039B25339
MILTETFPAEITSQFELPLILHSGGSDYDTGGDDKAPGMDLNQQLLRQPDKSFISRASGNALYKQGILDGDLLIVDCSLSPQHGDIVVAALEGELICRRLDLRNSLLTSDDEDLEDLPLQDWADLRIEGVVAHSITQHR